MGLRLHHIISMWFTGVRSVCEHQNRIWNQSEIIQACLCTTFCILKCKLRFKSTLFQISVYLSKSVLIYQLLSKETYLNCCSFLISSGVCAHKGVLISQQTTLVLRFLSMCLQQMKPLKLLVRIGMRKKHNYNFVLGLINRSVMTPPYLFQDNQINVKLVKMMSRNTVARDVCNSLWEKILETNFCLIITRTSLTTIFVTFTIDSKFIWALNLPQLSDEQKM
ncbi:hypothetical protein Bhyg_06129 [Pseudolycoriella hygida]|uniref:Uncharacterized protein n=1 Tax=Pseudolycoriella hygida TaxID=35572 RepID=A0A9Q0N000_9DIPT|nr:hypothetical protein Bhyg_06129 [Pseudolycoriella hygida]